VPLAIGLSKKRLASRDEPEIDCRNRRDTPTITATPQPSPGKLVSLFLLITLRNGGPSVKRSEAHEKIPCLWIGLKKHHFHLCIPHIRRYLTDNKVNSSLHRGYHRPLSQYVTSAGRLSVSHPTAIITTAISQYSGTQSATQHVNHQRFHLLANRSACPNLFPRTSRKRGSSTSENPMPLPNLNSPTMPPDPSVRTNADTTVPILPSTMPPALTQIDATQTRQQKTFRVRPASPPQAGTTRTDRLPGDIK